MGLSQEEDRFWPSAAKSVWCRPPERKGHAPYRLVRPIARNILWPAGASAEDIKT